MVGCRMSSLGLGCSDKECGQDPSMFDLGLGVWDEYWTKRTGRKDFLWHDLYEFNETHD